jgi:hypothetical protein
VRVLTWADVHRALTGRWPRATGAGPAFLPPGEKWRNIDAALQQGHRGLPGGDTLRRLLARRRGVGRPLRLRWVLRWADDHHRRTGRWPTLTSGPVVAAPGETWSAVNQALRLGLRGLPAGESLSRLLHRHGRGRHPGRPRKVNRAG